MSVILETYNSVFNEDAVDPRTKNWPLISGYGEVAGIIATYLVSIYIILPTYMRNRKPYNLQWIIRAYNAFQIIACSLMAYCVATSGWTTHYKLVCESVDYSNDKLAVRMAICMWWNMILKIIDLIETTFFVLRKKFDQVSFLHVYHHVLVVFLAWLVCRYVAGGMTTFTVLLNSCVHVLMYSYYLLASFGPAMQEKLKIIKSKLTAIQIIQLTIIFIYSLVAFSPSCRVNSQMKWINAIYVPTLGFMILLFLGFYIKSFTKKKKDI